MKTDDENLFEVRDLRKKLGRAQILDGLDLDIRRGEILFLLGRSGEGKSVLLKHLAGLIEPDGGRIRFDGTEIAGLSERDLNPIRRRVGMMFQDGALFDSMSVSENVAFPLEEEKLPTAEVRTRVKEALSLVGMKAHAGKMPINLSGGMRKRVALARVIISRPDVVLYDEPTAGLDPIGAGSIDNLIQRMRDTFGATSVVVTHDLTSVRNIADRVAVLRKGKLHFIGSLEALENSDDSFVQGFLAGRGEEEESG